MLSNTEINNPFGVEQHFCKPLEDGYLPQELNKEQTVLMLSILLKPQDEDSKLMEEQFTEAYWFYPAIEKRIEACFTYTMDARARMILCSWCESIGQCVMYLTYIQYLCKRRNIKHVDSLKLAGMFPSGIFTEQLLHKVWGMQKVQTFNNGSDNLVDYKTAMESILF